ncbi:hypothetical protein HDV01_007583 [Terramyces sp. JEL0728]|nr:hypothetical protein HDV01_007583 [Terramyces sp. JEL0728]
MESDWQIVESADLIGKTETSSDTRDINGDINRAEIEEKAEIKDSTYEISTRVAFSLKTCLLAFLLISQPLLFSIVCSSISFQTTQEVDFSSQAIYMDSFYSVNQHRWMGLENKTIGIYYDTKQNIFELLDGCSRKIEYYGEMVIAKLQPRAEIPVESDVNHLFKYYNQVLKKSVESVKEHFSTISRVFYRVANQWNKFFRCMTRAHWAHRMFGYNFVDYLYNLKLISRSSLFEKFSDCVNESSN